MGSLISERGNGLLFLFTVSGWNQVGGVGDLVERDELVERDVYAGSDAEAATLTPTVGRTAHARMGRWGRAAINTVLRGSAAHAQLMKKSSGSHAHGGAFI